MRTDAYGLPVSTSDPEALALYDRAVHALLSWHADALPLFRGAAVRDPPIIQRSKGPNTSSGIIASRIRPGYGTTAMSAARKNPSEPPRE